MPLISIITASYAPSAEYLPETIKSVEALELPDGWELEWIVQEDGDTPQLSERFVGVDIVRYAANGQQLGIASTRNLALSRASGVLLQALDQDDVLLSDAFLTLIPRFEEHPIHWAIGQADDLLPNGERRPYPSPISFGLQKAGVINAYAGEQGANWPIHGAALMLRAASFRALGGWSGIPYDDELATFAALSQITDGYYDEAITWLYRHHPKQTHRTEGSRALSAECRRFALQRAAILEASGLRFPPETAVGFESHPLDLHVGPAEKDTSL
ncbi:glycosyltransferase family 2 protein [Actinomadura rubrisoli]|uniref:Glycosyltransferase n=1 Tax=Actinomadura rubrisoli TaxID=2530368 RepID=A0A4R5ATS4_9ACTN|nr:glycosyltransferase [Actinomadura rubrisoli]TDD75795.1 glycosyltransferase [Actinomadura rubrisoli]